MNLVKAGPLSRSACTLLALFLLAFLLWGYAFRGFLFNRLSMDSDAVSYYEHIKFYTDNITRGIYPLWDPHWSGGVPNDFFLRRIGPYNPFVYLVVLFQKIGLSYGWAYLFYLAVYYFCGVIGFTLLAKRLFKDTVWAFLAFLLLYFSSLGTRLFDSYILFTFIPAVWFFFFLIAFTEEQKKHHFLGMTFTLMILFTTYIPFYFLVILATFLLCFALVYFDRLKSILGRYGRFLRGQKVLSALCILAFLFSLAPGYLFFKEGKKGEYALPLRHYEAPVSHVLGVDKKVVSQWAIAEDIVFSSFFTEDLRRFRFAILYFPLFAYVLLALGLITRVNRRIMFLLLWGIVLLLMGIPRSTPFYSYLYDHIFFFQYFRNLHFFLWLVLIPVFILLVVEQGRILLAHPPAGRKARAGMLVFVAMVHLGLAVFISACGKPLVTSYLVLAISFAFFCLYYTQRLKTAALWPLFFLAIVVPEPLHAYHYLQKNSPPIIDPYHYEGAYLDFSYGRGYPKDMPSRLSSREDGLEETEHITASKLYYAVSWYNLLRDNIDIRVFNAYLWHKFAIYDRVEWIDARWPGWGAVERSLWQEKNVAFLSLQDAESAGENPMGEADPRVPSQAHMVTGPSNEFIVTHFTANAVHLRTNFASSRFIVYNDAYHSGWRAFLDGSPIKLWRANIAFKGVWVPSGEHEIRLSFGSPRRYRLEGALLMVSGGLFVCLLLLWLRSHRYA